jgi:citrate lyase beta subunit
MSAPAAALARSFLFVPGSSASRVHGASGRGADVLVLDLEDAVPAEQKDAARETVVQYLREHSGPEGVAVRINGPGTPEHTRDMAALEPFASTPVMLPKADSASMSDLGPDRPVIALIETATGVEDAAAVARDPRVIRLMLGSADLAADVGFALSRDEAELGYARNRVAFASAVAHLPGPIDVVFLDVADEEGLRASADRGRALGFTGKACIHPAQIRSVNDAFRPSDGELAQARRIVEGFAAADGAGAVLIEGRMVDRPVVERARRTLALAP